LFRNTASYKYHLDDNIKPAPKTNRVPRRDPETRKVIVDPKNVTTNPHTECKIHFLSFF